MNKSPTNAVRKLANLPRVVRICAAEPVAFMAPLLLILFFCAGCNPNIDVDGALLPAWMVAMILGVILAVGARALLIRTGIDRFLVARALVYVSLAITFSCLVWLIVFRY